MTHHVTPPRVYLTTFFLLVVLMIATVFVSYLHLGPLNNLVALAIAVTKATLVVLFFMQVKYGTRLTWIWTALGFIWLLILFGTVGDYISREWLPAYGF